MDPYTYRLILVDSLIVLYELLSMEASKAYTHYHFKASPNLLLPFSYLVLFELLSYLMELAIRQQKV